MSCLPSTLPLQPRPHGLRRQAWQDLDHIDVQAELRRPVPTLQDVPPFLRACVHRALVFALQAVRDADLGEGVGTGITPTRAWTRFMLTPRMLMARPGAESLAARTRRPLRTPTNAATGQLCSPPRAAPPPHRPDGSRATEESDAPRKRRESASRLVRKGEVGRARARRRAPLAYRQRAGAWRRQHVDDLFVGIAVSHATATVPGEPAPRWAAARHCESRVSVYAVRGTASREASRQARPPGLPGTRGCA